MHNFLTQDNIFGCDVREYFDNQKSREASPLRKKTFDLGTRKSDLMSRRMKKLNSVSSPQPKSRSSEIQNLGWATKAYEKTPLMTLKPTITHSNSDVHNPESHEQSDDQ